MPVLCNCRKVLYFHPTLTVACLLSQKNVIANMRLTCGITTCTDSCRVITYDGSYDMSKVDVKGSV